MADFPSGIILLWYGSLESIPAGWLWCDGNFGTPNLKSKFIVGHGAAYPIGQIGGATVHSHTFTANNHKHTIASGAAIAAGANFKDETELTAANGTTDDGSSLPPYHALAWIMKT